MSGPVVPLVLINSYIYIPVMFRVRYSMVRSEHLISHCLNIFFFQIDVNFFLGSKTLGNRTFYYQLGRIIFLRRIYIFPNTIQDGRDKKNQSSLQQDFLNISFSVCRKTIWQFIGYALKITISSWSWWFLTDITKPRNRPLNYPIFLKSYASEIEISSCFCSCKLCKVRLFNIFVKYNSWY